MTVNEGTGEFVTVPAGNHPGRIAAILDCGTHLEDKTKDDGTKYQADTRKLVLVYELAKKQPNGEPFTIAQKFTWSMHEKSSFFGLVTQITGKKFAAGEKFNPTDLLGKPIMVNVVHKGSNGKTFANVGTVSQFPDGFPLPTFEYGPVLWSVMDRTPFPDADWFPFSYGQSLHNFAAESKEGAAFMVPTSSTSKPSTARTEPGVSSPAANPSQPATPTHGRTQPPPDVAKIMAKCSGLAWPYMLEELPEFQSDLTPREFTVLSDNAVPY